MMVKTCADTQTISLFINDLTYSPYLAEEKRNVCEGILAYDECYNVLQTFQKNLIAGERWFNSRVFLSLLALVSKVGS